MESIKKILSAVDLSAESMDVATRVEISGGEALDGLTIEKVSNNRLSVSHTYTQRGDLMRDPEVIFEVDDDEWMPIEFTQDPIIHHHDESGLDLEGFLQTWSKNLRQQGFVQKARDEDVVVHSGQ